MLYSGEIMKATIVLSTIFAVIMMANTVGAGAVEMNVPISGGWYAKGNETYFSATLGLTPAELDNMGDLTEWNADITISCLAYTENETLAWGAFTLPCSVYPRSLGLGLSTSDVPFLYTWKPTNNIREISIKKRIIKFSY